MKLILILWRQYL